MSGNVLIIDDEKKLCNLLARIIELEGFKVFQAYTGKDGLKQLKQEDIQVVISDVRLPDYNGVELVKEIKKIRPWVEVINLTAFGAIADGVMAMRNGAFDYITKGDDNDKIIPLVYKALGKAMINVRLRDPENKALRKYTFKSILGSSQVIQAAISLAIRVAKTNTTVLLLGKTGTGKEVFAQSIHYEGPRKLKNFVAINCSAFGSELLESELFGYKAGAFTGALKDKKGLLEEANEGTLFLDEIGEMSLDLQSKLLRVLEDQTYIKVGDTQTRRANVRIIAATNKDLKASAEEGKFRIDLYYRLSVFVIELPTLSERREDILPIALYYLNEFTENLNRPALGMDKEFSILLTNYSWKGNIRELKNVMERVAILAERNIVTPELLSIDFHQHGGGKETMNMQVMERQHIIKVIKFTKGNKTETARLLGIGLTTLYRKIEEYQIEI
ncbi:MAG: sigma-54-dependent transcriptional regulator [Sphingobacteriaceae bacterium]